jgi:hypothetical protein
LKSNFNPKTVTMAHWANACVARPQEYHLCLRKSSGISALKVVLEKQAHRPLQTSRQDIMCAAESRRSRIDKEFHEIIGHSGKTEIRESRIEHRVFGIGRLQLF